MKVEIEPRTANSKYSVDGVTLDGVALEHIGASSRSVWGNDEVVIKLEFESRDLKQTRGERVTWERLEECDRKYFAPFIASGCVDNAPSVKWSMQARISGGHRLSEWSGPEYRLMSDLFSKYGLSRDFGLSQFFIVNGEPIAHDYGYTDDFDAVYNGNYSGAGSEAMS
jgi:hypothetical protein